MKRFLKPLLSYFVLVVFLLLAAWYIYSNWHEFINLSITDPVFIVPTIIFILANIYGTGILLDLTIEPHGVKLTKREAFGLANITRFSNQFSPSYIGASVRAAYLKKIYGVSYASFSSSFIVSNLLQFILSGIFAVALFFTITPSTSETMPLVTMGIIILLLILLLCMPVARLIAFTNKLEGHKKGLPKKVLERFAVLLGGYATVRKHPRLLPNMIVWMTITIVSSGFIYFFLYLALGVKIDIFSALFISALTNWSIVFSITPGNIGVREGLMVVAAQIVGVSIAATLLAALLVRLLVFVVSGTLSLYYAPRLLNTSVFNLTKK